MGNNSVNVDFEIEMLVREIALKRFLEDENPQKADPLKPPHVVQAKDEAYQAFNCLTKSADEALKTQLFDLEDKLNSLARLEHELEFVNGFVEGYFYLRHVMKYQEAALLSTAEEGGGSK
ncbi:hypothetical protein [Paenibacillus popilliae]|uniref:DNA and RNA helicase n=1 Tax=Paenibacillus popilliae ATCC 14706 TaxID=1212764 RepID=M9LCT0_PAEPP|nr:hypothetical protein [Paenibacillus popilliae]GAC44007.1 DNA and RNA helicase [Paenibacillus popilliae ATCC 14706]